MTSARRALLPLPLRLSLCLVPALLAAACGESGPEPGVPPATPSPAPVPCGIMSCSEAQDNVENLPPLPQGGAGKADAATISGLLATRLNDGVLDAEDVRAVFASAGDSMSQAEMLALRDALEGRGPGGATGYQVTEEAKGVARELALVANLFSYERDLLSDPKATSYGGSAIPAAVRELIGRARLNGAAAFDVNEQDSDGEGIWSPYPSTTPPVENMTFDYTEITPEKLAADIADKNVTYNAIVGTEKAMYCDAQNQCKEYERVKYEMRQGGTGHVEAQFDEAYHPDIYARGTYGQKWANNCAILADGGLHCLPAARRSVIQDLILTNPHLSRCNNYQGFEEGCRHMLYNGHVDIRGGVVESIEISGRLSKRVAKGDARLVDPIAVLQAWGFQISPNLRIDYGNTGDGVPVRDTERGVLRAPDSTN